MVSPDLMVVLFLAGAGFLVFLFLLSRQKYWNSRLTALEARSDAEEWASVIASDYLGSALKGFKILDFIFAPSMLAVPYDRLASTLLKHGESRDRIADMMAAIMNENPDSRKRFGALLLLASCWPSKTSKETLLQIADNPDDPLFVISIRCLYFNIDQGLAVGTLARLRKAGKIDNVRYNYFMNGFKK